MRNIYELIETIKVRTALYTGEHKLSNIDSFITGYLFAIENEERYSEFESDFRGFNDWVAAKLGFRGSTAGWQNMILAIEMGLSPKEFRWENYAANATEEHHRASVAKFFEFIDEYRETNQIAQEDTTALDDS